ncbi:transcriptional regulator [Leptospira yasudae]|uniref:Transcriptional regulator n=1 Tax=Leptospira yasudae TaxID=2202201 RepID=A0A6N4QZ26_9LEPT|nr:transcriptional regulator [Leptospira yasudae]TGL81446.1 transcriptional regulator [Leptospira yasudae]TGL81711.1 transcriptional regulator [Leptospira yasudae]TGL88087.1 transcriptional regulator [Leptospira yasudae]
MKDQKKRLKIILSQFKGNQTDFGLTIGKSKQTISGWLSGRFPIPEDAAITIEMVHGFKREWVLKGELPEKVSRSNSYLKSEAFGIDSSLLKKIASNQNLQELIEILSKLPKKDFEIVRKFLLGYVKEDSQSNS